MSNNRRFDEAHN